MSHPDPAQTVVPCHGRVLVDRRLPGVQPSREVPRVLGRKTAGDFYGAPKSNGTTLKEITQRARDAVEKGENVELEVLLPRSYIQGLVAALDAVAPEDSVDFFVNDLRATVHGTDDPDVARERAGEGDVSVMQKTRVCPAARLDRWGAGARANLKRETAVPDPSGEVAAAIAAAALGTYAWRAKRRRSLPVPGHEDFRLDVTEVTDSTTGNTRTEVELECLAPERVTDKAVIAALRALGAAAK